MPKLIDADKLTKELKRDSKRLNIREREWANTMIHLISIAPTIDAEPVRHGRWRLVTKPSDTFDGYRCSECNELVYGKTNYCPNCGAKMDEGEKTLTVLNDRGYKNEL